MSNPGPVRTRSLDSCRYWLTLFVFLDEIFIPALTLFQSCSGPRRPSFELRRTMSWTVAKQEGPYEGEGQFFLPRNFSTPVTAKLHEPRSTDTSECSETDAT